jgi:hypothetical protein
MRAIGVAGTVDASALSEADVVVPELRVLRVTRAPTGGLEIGFDLLSGY